MNKILSLITIFFFGSCVSQQTTSIISENEINSLTLVKQEKCTDNIIIFDNQEDFNIFQSQLEKTGPRSAPIFMVDFTTKNVAIICKQQIDAYQIKNIEVRKKSNILNVEKIEGYDNYDTNINTLIIEIPKRINTLEINNTTI